SRALVGKRGLDPQRVQRQGIVVLRVCRCRVDDFLDFAGDGHRQVTQDCDRLRHSPPFQWIEDQAHLPRGSGEVLASGADFHYFLLTAVVRSARPPAWPRNVRVGANSPRRWPTMFSVMNTGTWRRPSCTAIVRPS